MTALPDPARIESKGFTLQSALAYAEARHGGAAARERLLATVDDASRAVLSGHLLAGSWYPFRVQVATYEAIDRLWGRGDFALCWDVGRFTAEVEATTIHKLFLKIARLETWLRVAGTLWGRYYSAGTLDVGEFRDGHGELAVREFHPISKAFCHDLGGWFWRTAELSGHTGVHIDHAACVLDGAPACRYVATWRS
jgi:hypothetical protein